MRVVFAGTPDFAARVLDALLASGHEVAAVLTPPDRPSGRGRRLRASPVKTLAEARGVPVLQPATLRMRETRARLRALEVEVIAVAAYGMLLPPEMLAVPRAGCINVHPSLLPRWRGAAPIERAILAGDEHTGVSIMRMDEGFDTGAVLARSEIPIRASDSAGDLRERLAALGARLLVATLDHLPRSLAGAQPQRDAEACYAAPIAKREARIDWQRSARELDRVVRAMNPAPVAFTTVPAARGGWRRLRIWRARPVPRTGEAAPGRVVRAASGEVEVAAGEGGLALLEVQAEGGRRMPVAEYIRARPLRPGTRLGLGSSPYSPA